MRSTVLSRMTGTRILALIAAVVAMVLLGGMTTPVAAAQEKFKGPKAQKTRVTPVKPVRAKVTAPARPVVQPWRTAKVVWPAQGTTTVALAGAAASATALAPSAPAAAAKSAAKPKAAGPGPWHAVGSGQIRVRSSDAARTSAVQLKVASQGSVAKLGLSGVVLQVNAADGRSAGQVDLAIDTREFAGAYGGGWGSRLRLVTLPACALTTPQKSGCLKQTVVPDSFVNADGTVAGTVSVPATAPAVSAASTTAPVTAAVAGVVVALAAAPSGPAGSYTATPLSQSSSWSVGQQSGTFSWNYPLRVPPAVNGPAPDLAVGYNSGAVDGRSAASNSQPSWIGEGFDLGVGYVERKYASCADDQSGGNNTVKTGDLCWKSDNAVISLNGHSTELVKDSGSGAWKLKDDDGSRVELLTGATGSPDNNGEYWKVTTTDGTQYFFGKTKRYATDPIADSGATWTVPVAGNQTGEPCRATAFKDSFCNQAWRWNVDHVVDANGNTMSYTYARESNRYQRMAAMTADASSVAYTMSGYLTRIDYGQRSGSEVTVAPSRVVFTTAERCLPDANFDCAASKLTSANAARWPDVPFEQICTSTTSCGTNGSPTFFTRKRLTAVSTQVLTAANTMDAVEKWDLTQDFYNSGDPSGGGLQLKGITHTGTYGGTKALPSVTFAYELYPNRVSGLIDGPVMYKPRLTLVADEAGGQINPHYDRSTGVLCTSTSLPASPASNTKRCYPNYWTPEGASTPTLTWFYKYLVDQVTEGDQVGGGLAKVTSLTYVGNAAWKYDDNEITPAKYRTWSDWRGYGTVEERVGDSTVAKTLTRTIYLRGMDGNRDAAGNPVSVSVADSKGGTVPDAERVNGTALDTTVFNGTAAVSTTISKPWVSGPTATGNGKTARLTGPDVTTTYVPITGGGERQTRVTTTTDGTYGTVTQVDDEGDVATTADDLCTRYTYTRNGTAWITSTVSRQQVASVKCATTPTAAQQVSDTRTLYDGGAFGAAPAKGNVTEAQALKTAGGTDYGMRSKAGYDNWGRVISATDAMNNVTTTTYTQLAVTGQSYTGGTVKATTLDPKSFSATTDLNVAWGAPSAETDINSRVTSLAYDPLGRLTSVWLPTRAKATYPATPSMRFDYTITKSAPTVVTSQELLDAATDTPSYISRYSILDGLLRERQSQAPEAGTNGGRVINDVEYDSRGFVTRQNGPYYATGTASGTLVTMTDVQKSVSHELTYDAAGRVTLDRFMAAGVEKQRTATSYGGTYVVVDPPDGIPATATQTDARGRVDLIRRFHGNYPDGALGSDDTTYQYYPDDKLKKVTDASGASWDYTYDLRGRLASVNDPDKGLSQYTYNENDQVVTTLDSRGKTIWTGYDVLGRVTQTRLNSSTGTQLTGRSYDTVTGAKGKPASTTRYSGGNAYTSAITGYDAAYRPTGSTVTIPAAEGSLAGTYTTSHTYSANGSLTLQTLPAVPGMPAETMINNYDGRLGNQSAVSSNVTGSIVAAVTRSPFGEGLIQAMGQANSPAIFLGQAFEEGTRRLTAQTAQRANQNNAYDVAVSYSYDAAGNVTSAKDAPTVSGTEGETQCYGYDYAAQLTNAWTPTSGNCGTAPTVAGLGGPAGYWHSFGYDIAGNRKNETIHSGFGDTNRTYTYPAVNAQGKGQPHTLTKLVSQPDFSAATTIDYQYDTTGNNTTQTKSGAVTGSQTYGWDDEGRLSSASGLASGTYIYDGDGERLIRKEAGKTTLYLDATEVELNTATSALTSTRYYAFDGKTVAMRQSGSGLRVLMTDIDGSAIWSVDTATANDARRRRFAPFGTDRAGFNPAVWPGNHGFIEGKQDATGLTFLGARAYDPSIGRFLSVDPVMTPDAPSTHNPYRYSENNPVTLSDPSGLSPWWGNLRRLVRDVVAGIGAVAGSKSAQAQLEYEQAARALNAAKANGAAVRDKLITAAKQLGKIAADELGITAALDCFTQGDIGGCAETAVNVVSSLAGGLAGKIITKYAWHWRTAAKLAKTIYRLGSEIISGVKGMMSARKELALAQDTFDRAVRSCLTKQNSFAASTPVVMADSSKKPISKVTVGDKVKAVDPATGMQTVGTVTHTYINLDKNFTDLTFIKKARGRAPPLTTTLHTTRDHPIWDATAGGFAKAVDLPVGHRIRADDDQIWTLSSVRSWTGSEQMYDLTVDTAHTFYVGTGHTSILVHNCGISMDRAVELGAAHVGGEGRMVQSGSKAWQFINTSVDESGNTVTRIARFDINPESAHVQQYGPHLNLETQINKVTVRSGPMADPHMPIDPATIRDGDIP